MMRRFISSFVFGCIFAVASPLYAADPPHLITFKRNGGWNWFCDNRVLVDDDKLLIGTVAGTTKEGSTAGDVQLTAYYFASKAVSTFTLDPAVAADDHLVPVLLKRPDGRYLAIWQRHDADALLRWRISINPGDATSWQPVQSVSANTVDSNGLTFAHAFSLPAEQGRIYSFVRSVGFDPNYLISDDQGQSFRYGGHLMMWENPGGTAKGKGRPYIRYVSNGADTIYFATTEDHPAEFDNGILAGYLKGGTLHKSDGASVGPLSTTPETTIKPTDFTRVFQGTAGGVAYINDIKLAANGQPHLVFSVRKDAAGTDIRYWYARWAGGDGRAWNAHEIAHAGSTIYAGESSYAGLAALDPADADVMYLSANSDPKTGQPLVSKADGKRHYEIFRATTRDGGATWSFKPVTRDSAADNIRPLVVGEANKPHALLWLRGTMTTYKNYDLDIVGLLTR